MTESIDRVREALERAGVHAPIRRLDGSARTAALAAAQLGVAVGAIANSLIFRVDGQPLLILASGAHRVDTERVAQQLGVGPIERADADFVRQHTGQVIGGVSPVGHPTPLPTVVDAALEQYPQLWAAAGHPHAVFPTDFHQLVAMTRGTPLPVAAADPDAPGRKN